MKIFAHFALLLITTAAFAAGPATRTTYDITLKNGFTLHTVRLEVVGPNTRVYTDADNYIEVPSSEIASVAESQAPVPAPEFQQRKSDINQVVTAASEKHQVDPDLISSVIHAESDFNAKAVSPKGAEGLMQLMPETAARLGVSDAFDPGANVDAGTEYLRELLLRYKGDVVKALAAYNAGPLRVQQYHGVPPYRETRSYVAHVVKEFNRKKLAQRAASKHAAAKSGELASNSGQQR